MTPEPTPNRPPSLGGYLIPNVLSATRLVLAFAFPWLPLAARGPVALVAGLTDLLDGYLSRAWHATSAFGRLLDPIADKAFVLAVLVTLLSDGSLTWPALALLALRDLTVLAGAAWLALRRDWAAFGRMEPRWLGKAATNALFVYLCLLLFGVPYSDWFFPVAAGLSALAAADYARLLPGVASPRR